ncbi:MAG: hypothetical protein COA78_35310, partial [Blastopirellula sp.]
AQYEHDQVRGSVGSGMLSLRIPFGKGGKSSKRRLNALGRRMVNPIVRDIDIVSNQKSTFGALEGVKVGDLGQEIDAYHTITTSDDVEDYIENTASTNALIVIDGTPGTYNYASEITIQSGQAIIGGGGTVEFTGINSGTKLNHTFSGTSPVLSNSNSGSKSISMADYGVVNNIHVQGGDDGIYSLSKNYIQISNSTVSGATDDGFFIKYMTDGLIIGNTANNNGDGFILKDMTDGLIIGNASNNNGDKGLSIRNSSNMVINENTSVSNGHGFLSSNTINSTFNNNTATNNTISGYSLFTGMTGTTRTGNTGSGNAINDLPIF